MMDATPNQTPLFGIELIRDYVLTDLLGSDYRQVIYWAGKRLARQFPVVDESELSSFFEQAGWGTLEIKKQKGTVISYILFPPETTRDERPQGYFQLEAGFLAEQHSRFNACVAEGYAEVNKELIQITVQIDPKDPLDPIG
ncbi:DUF2507 domain-containing protein [Exiguobacterium acetylicum]|uniref:DUF2507 domain-containing protein n=1 Tax=Exiguobacterium acetylicum TaxID=41170 RepID=UPI00397746E7